jgi:hypothetical protein
MAELCNFIVSLAGSMILFATVLYLYRAAARKLLRKKWMHWYVRRAVDWTIVGFCFLLIGATGGKGNDHLPEGMSAKIQPLWSRVFSELWRGDGDRREPVMKSYWHLRQLADIKWFLDNFFLFTIFPAFAVAFIGYSIERGTEKTQSTTKP